MNHPEQTEWVPYLFGEGTPNQRARLQAHLRECPECRARLESWQQVRTRLDDWSLASPKSPPLPQPLAAIARWAAVVVVAAGVGALAGRWSAPRMPPTPRDLPRSGDSATVPDATRELAAVVERLKRENDARFFALRRDLETVAATTDSALRQTRQGLALLNVRSAPDLQ